MTHDEFDAELHLFLKSAKRAKRTNQAMRAWRILCAVAGWVGIVIAVAALMFLIVMSTWPPTP